MKRRRLVFAVSMVLALDLGAKPRVLATVADVPLPGHATRFDYQSLDSTSDTLFIAHMGDGELLAFDTASRSVTHRLAGLPLVTGVLSIPAFHRVYASVAAAHEVAVVDTDTWQVVVRVPAGQFPDGLAYSPETGKVFVSDEHGGMETVIDVRGERRVGVIDMGGEVGNTQYDPGTGRILANVQTHDELVVIDPATEKIVERHALPGGRSPHGLLIVSSLRLAFVACEDSSNLLVVDLRTFEVTQILATGPHPDVLAFDEALGRLYVATESGILSVFDLRDRVVVAVADLHLAPHAHSVAVDPRSHEVYLPLENVDGGPVLRIMRPEPARISGRGGDGCRGSVDGCA